MCACDDSLRILTNCEAFAKQNRPAHSHRLAPRTHCLDGTLFSPALATLLGALFPPCVLPFTHYVLLVSRASREPSGWAGQCPPSLRLRADSTLCAVRRPLPPNRPALWPFYRNLDELAGQMTRPRGVGGRTWRALAPVAILLVLARFTAASVPCYRFRNGNDAAGMCVCVRARVCQCQCVRVVVWAVQPARAQRGVEADCVAPCLPGCSSCTVPRTSWRLRQ